jgi:hypothetical protein
MPYDIGRPTIRKIANRLWNPADPRIFMPKILGIGWDVNFGAIAVKLGLLRPDDEEELPFANVPDWALSIGLLLPATLNALALLVAVIFFNKLPAEVPVHYGFARPDRFSNPIGATLWWLAPSLLMMAILYYSVFVKRRSRLARAFSVAFLSSISIMGCGLYINSVYYALNDKLVFFAGLPVIAGLITSFLVLITLSKLGLREEWQRHNVIKARKTRSKEKS